jgi:Tfp pilus assembly protein PilF
VSTHDKNSAAMRQRLVLAAILLLLAGCSSEPVQDIKRGFENLFGKDEQKATTPSQSGTEPAPTASRKEAAPAPSNEGESLLRAGISQYESGRYDESARSLRIALKRGLSKPDQVTAHKYLAFIQCASGREAQCRDEFKRALRIDPDMTLAPAEAGHPIWGPVFKSVKAGD